MQDPLDNITQEVVQSSERPVKVGTPLLARRLSTKLLLLTIIFVLIAEVLIFIPSVANMRLRWLQDQLNTTASAGILLARSEIASIPSSVRDELLETTGAKSIALRTNEGTKMLVHSDGDQVEIDSHVDLRTFEPVRFVIDALKTLFFGGDMSLRVTGAAGNSEHVIEIVIEDTRLRQAMLIYSRNVAFLSLMISIITAALLYAAINMMMIRPIRSITRNMLEFAQNPEDQTRVIAPDIRSDEIGATIDYLRTMQLSFQKTLSSQKRLANLGLAVSKINHDLRNVLASAQLISDRLIQTSDPLAERFVPKLMRTLDRAVSYTSNVLSYGSAQEAPPKCRTIKFQAMVNDVGEMLSLETEDKIEFVNLVPESLEVEADPEHLFRILSNLARNAVQALLQDHDPSIVHRITIDANQNKTQTFIIVSDTGPGLPAKAKKNLFLAFHGGARSGGTGLGLAIVDELVRAHGGSIELTKSGGGLTQFRITLPRSGTW